MTGKHGRGRVALVDDEDYELVSRYRWYAIKSDDRYYACSSSLPGTYPGRTHIRMHMLLTGNALTDHKNGNGLDNQRENLRAATYTQNLMNQRVRSDSTTGYRGVTREAHGWRAVVKANGVRKHLGYFSTPELAARAYDAAAVEMHGEFARLNFPDDPQHEMPLRVPLVRQCARPDCGEEFRPVRIHARYCSRRCIEIMNYRTRRVAQGATLRKSPRRRAA